MKPGPVLRGALFLSGILLLVGAVSGQAGRGTGRINGLVLDEAGRPIVGAKILIVFAGNETVTQETVTDKKGQWAAIGLGSGLWRVTVEAAGYKTVITSITVKQLEKNPTISSTLKKEGTGDDAMVVENKDSLGLVEKAGTLFKEGKFDEALAVYEEIKAKNPGIYLVDLTIGDCWMGKGDCDKAIEIYQGVLEKARADFKAGKEPIAKTLARIGECYVKKEDIEKAQDFFKQSLEAQPGDEILAYNVGEIYFSNRKLDEAVQYFAIAAQIKPDWAEAHYKLGLARLSKTDYDKAREAFARFLELEPDSERAAGVKNILETIGKIKK